MSKSQEKLHTVENQPATNEDANLSNEASQVETAQANQATNAQITQNNVLESFPFISKLQNAWSAIKKALEAPITKPNLNQEWLQQIKDKVTKLFGGSGQNK